MMRIEHWTGFKTLAKREILRYFVVYTQTLLPPLVSSTLFFFVFGLSIGRNVDLAIPGVSYIQFIVPGLVMMHLIDGSYANCSSSLFMSRWHNLIQELLLSPLSYFEMVLGLLLGGVTRGMLAAGGVWAVSLFFAQSPVQHPWVVAYFFLTVTIIFACLGLLVNLLTAAILHGSSPDDLNIRSAFFHMLGDTFSSVGVVAGAVVIYATHRLWIDPLLSIGIGFLILVWGFRLLRDSCHILLESTPRHIQSEEVAKTITDHIQEVKEIHDIHIWEITSKMYAMTAHVAVNDIRVSESKVILDKINHLVEERFEIGHTNIQFEVVR